MLDAFIIAADTRLVIVVVACVLHWIALGWVDLAFAASTCMEMIDG